MSPGDQTTLIILSSYHQAVQYSFANFRFRGMISTQPGSTPSSSFKIVSLEEDVPSSVNNQGNDIGPFGDQDDEQVFVQKVIPETDVITVRLASGGTRVCEIR